jgi:hypothetical protein
MSILTVSGVLLILLPIGFNVSFFLLGRNFEYPGILRKPTDYILLTFHERRKQIIPLWYAFMFTALLFIFAGMLVPMALAPDGGLLVTMVTALALLAGLTQVLGLIRWPFVVPHLARKYTDPSTSQAAREAITVVFEAIHRYAGVAIGEHLGYLFTALWTLLVGIMLAGSPAFPAWLGWIAFIPALGILAGLLEEVGLAVAGAINAVSYLLWSLWLVVLGVFFLLS